MHLYLTSTHSSRVYFIRHQTTHSATLLASPSISVPPLTLSSLSREGSGLTPARFRHSSEICFAALTSAVQPLRLWDRSHPCCASWHCCRLSESPAQSRGPRGTAACAWENGNTSHCDLLQLLHHMCVAAEDWITIVDVRQKGC